MITQPFRNIFIVILKIKLHWLSFKDLQEVSFNFYGIYTIMPSEYFEIKTYERFRINKYNMFFLGDQNRLHPFSFEASYL